MKAILLTLSVVASIMIGLAHAQTPGPSANTEAGASTVAKSGFLQDTNRNFPLLFIVGDSTVHNSGRNERGWGDVIGRYFQTNNLRVENHALGGRSSRTFITQGWWQKILDAAKPGDFVLLQMGHNDGGPLDDTNRARGTIRGLGEETRDIFNPITKKPETVHTYGWYLRQYIADAHARGMTLVLCSPVPHSPKEQVKPGEVEKNDYVTLSAAVAAGAKVPFIHLNQIVMDHYAALTPAEIKEKYFTPADNTHTSPAGAELNALGVVEGLRQLKDFPLTRFLRHESAATDSPTESWPPATITSSNGAITLANGLVSLTLAQKGGRASSIKYRQDGQFIELGNGRNALYFDVNGGKVYPVADAQANIIHSGPDAVEVAFAGAPTTAFPFASEMHVIIRRGEPGFYAYAAYRHGPGMAAGGFSETRFVVRGRPGTGIFTHHIVDDERQGAYPTAENARTIQDATWQLTDGSYYTKYNNSAFMADHHVHGMAGHGLGVWMILPSTEFIGGGPYKQELTVHKDNTLLAMLVGAHFGSGSVRLEKDEPWDKIYGPVFVYFNHGPAITNLWQDAQQRAATEIARWPSQWLKRENYPLPRATVTGQLKLTDGTSPAGAWAMLVPPDEDWTQVIKGYNFWTRVRADGQFQLTGVRPGRYTLIFTGANQFQEFRATNLTVQAGTTHLGPLDWHPVQHGIRLWQMGVADRSSGEFKDGDDFRHYENHLRYATNFPNDVAYVIGQSKPGEDWNFAHWTWFNQVPYWTIRFNLTNEWQGQATLTLGLASVIPAGSLKCKLAVKVNGRQIAVVEQPKSGTAGYRSGNQDSVYNSVTLRFDASLLHSGENQITLGHLNAERTPAPDQRRGVPGVVMYDAIRLEIDTNRPAVSLPLGN